MPPFGSSINALRGSGISFKPPLLDVSYSDYTSSDGTANSWGPCNIGFNFNDSPRPYVMSCWAKLPEGNAEEKPCNFSLVEVDTTWAAGYKSARSYHYPSHLDIEVYWAGGQLGYNVPTIHDVDTHDWYHIVMWMADESQGFFAINGTSFPGEVRYDGPWEACSSSNGMKKIGRFTKDGSEYAPQSWNGYMTQWFMMSQAEWDNLDGKYYTSTGDRHRDVMNLTGEWKDGFWIPKDFNQIGTDRGQPEGQFITDIANGRHGMYIPFDGTGTYHTNNNYNVVDNVSGLSKKSDEPVFAWPVDPDGVSVQRVAEYDEGYNRFSALERGIDVVKSKLEKLKGG